MFGLKKVKKQEPSPYANRRDFCRIFEKDMDRLYLLSFLLTGDEAIAEQCFVGGLHIAQEGNPVFKEWAESWARRAILLNAIRMVRPRASSEPTGAVLSRSAENDQSQSPEINGILTLPTFERFAFVMAVLEGYSDHECALHLNCTVGDVRTARTRALGRLASFSRTDGKVLTIPLGQKTSESDARSGLEPETVSGLAASA
jgi:DNA-directed RNA polymerase specialized sigma24 family protein